MAICKLMLPCRIYVLYTIAATQLTPFASSAADDSKCSATDSCESSSKVDDVALAEDSTAETQKVSLLQGKFRHSRKFNEQPSPRCPERAPWPEPPKTATEYNGIEWPELCFDEHEESVAFFMGDYGGITCGDEDTLGSGQDPNAWTCHGKDGVYVKTADNTGDHDDRGRYKVWGTDDIAQQKVARQMQHWYNISKPHYALNGGDNFYFGGLDHKCGHPMNETHPRTRLQFDKVFEEMYAGIDVPFFSVFGNHDFGGRMFDAAWDQQIAYTWAANTTSRWIMPGFFWHQRVRYPKGNFSIDYFMIDTNAGDAKPHNEDVNHNICGDFNAHGASCGHTGGPENKYVCKDWFWNMWDTQAAWLIDKLENSDADWQIVLTHFPPDQFQGHFWKNLFTKYGIDLFVGSHRHSQEVHINDRRFGGLNWVVCGGGGGITSEWNPDDGDRGRDQYGFMNIKVSKTSLQLVAINERGEIRRNETISPRPAQGELSCKHYGCGGEYTDWQGCQCTADCWLHQNCCDDFAETCPQFARCEEWGCSSAYDWRKPCQCIEACVEKGNCCTDYTEKCNASCTNYGCGIEYQKWQACSCSADCWMHSNCCSDFAAECSSLASCANYGCAGRYDGRKPCQCTTDCAEHGNCCSDWYALCDSPEARAAQAACDTECELKGQSHSCRIRVEFAMSSLHQSRSEAVAAINKECEGQCNCTEVVISAALLEHPSAKAMPVPQTREDIGDHDEKRTVDEEELPMPRDEDPPTLESDLSETLVEKKAKLWKELHAIEAKLFAP